MQTIALSGRAVRKGREEAEMRAAKLSRMLRGMSTYSLGIMAAPRKNVRSVNIINRCAMYRTVDPLTVRENAVLVQT